MNASVMTLVLVLATLLLSACAQRGPGGVALGSRGEPRDRITASDEPEVSRRARVRLELASAYFARGQMTTALDEVKQSIALDPNVSAAFNLRGLIYSNLGDHVLAEDSFRRALAIDRLDADVMQNYGWYLCQQQRYADAEALFKQALEVPQYRDTPRTLLTKGVCQARAGRTLEAEATLRRAYELDPSSPVIAVNLSEVLYRRGEFERARFIMQRINGKPDVVNAQTLWLAAKIENKLGNRQGVQTLGDQLRGRFPQAPETTAYERRQFDE